MYDGIMTNTQWAIMNRDNGIFVKENGSRKVLTFESKSDAEKYLRRNFNGLKYSVHVLAVS